jgi:hypothetical protein
MTSQPISLSALKAARAAMIPGVYAWEPHGLLASETDDPTDPIILGELDVSEENGCGIVATHNAADVLIEIALAAKAWRSASNAAAAARLALARATERADIDFGYTQVDEFDKREVAARDAFDAAIAKVTL